jgi:hypothetical protein
LSIPDTHTNLGISLECGQPPENVLRGRAADDFVGPVCLLFWQFSTGGLRHRLGNFPYTQNRGRVNGCSSSHCHFEKKMSATENRLERRAAQRFEVHVPVAVHFEGRTVPGFTQDLSGRGMFFYVEAELPEGAAIELTFIMPSEITLGESMPVRCGGRVLRSTPTQGGRRRGVAVQLESYEYLPLEEAQSMPQCVRISAATSGAGARPLIR